MASVGLRHSVRERDGEESRGSGFKNPPRVPPEHHITSVMAIEITTIRVPLRLEKGHENGIELSVQETIFA
jgi:hypothetical protein